MLEIAFVFSKGLHHRLGVSDFARGLGGKNEAELVEQELMDPLGLSVAFHPQLTAGRCPGWLPVKRSNG